MLFNFSYKENRNITRQQAFKLKGLQMKEELVFKTVNGKKNGKSQSNGNGYHKILIDEHDSIGDMSLEV